ncbi:hypothetical protein BGZ96_003877, partial [Linnemannia gamsii]
MGVRFMMWTGRDPDRQFRCRKPIWHINASYFSFLVVIIIQPYREKEKSPVLHRGALALIDDLADQD